MTFFCLSVTNFLAIAHWSMKLAWDFSTLHRVMSPSVLIALLRCVRVVLIFFFFWPSNYYYCLLGDACCWSFFASLVYHVKSIWGVFFSMLPACVFLCIPFLCFSDCVDVLYSYLLTLFPSLPFAFSGVTILVHRLLGIVCCVLLRST
ncbi:hypothetical protein BDZ91DRAFT_748407 [Kalaharituber pfeilii]|nr:hypothetical protein BDZ91DRAFT_748407 [Kalaharituber pfeilii]